MSVAIQVDPKVLQRLQWLSTRSHQTSRPNRKSGLTINSNDQAPLFSIAKRTISYLSCDIVLVRAGVVSLSRRLANTASQQLDWILASAAFSCQTMDIWIFGYGSLVYRPGKSAVIGWHLGTPVPGNKGAE
jgi:hypothetical protein